MTWTKQAALVPDWDQKPSGFHPWDKSDPRGSVTYWDLRFTTWDQTETSWDTNTVQLVIWSKQ